jgi:type II secretory pathway component PulF
VIPILGLLYGAYYLITLPLRRQERASFFLDLLETGFRQGRSPEESLVAISKTKDRDLGVQFHLLAAHMEWGSSLGEALNRMPAFLPPQIRAMLEVGEKIGDVPRIIPTCRALLKDGHSRMRSAFNYAVITLVVFPVLPVMLSILSQTVLPKYGEIFSGSLGEGMPLPRLTRWVTEMTIWIAAGQFALGVVLLLGFKFYIGGVRLWHWLEAGLWPVSDAFLVCFPWRRKRLQRDFCKMLALLLDASVPEVQAIQLAARSTANRVFTRRAEKAIADLQAGKGLAEALRRFDEANEFSWRIANAGKTSGGFLQALAGWIEALDAKAFQQEQAASQFITTGLVLLNGVVVGLVVVGFFQPLIELVNRMALW